MRTYSSPQVTSRAREKCLVDGCTRLEELASGRSAGGLCAGHRKRKQQQAKGRLTVPFESPIHEGMGRRRSPRAALIDAAMSLGDVDTNADFDAAFRRAVDRLTHAAMRYREARRLSERRKLKPMKEHE